LAEVADVDKAVVGGKGRGVSVGFVLAFGVRTDWTGVLNEALAGAKAAIGEQGEGANLAATITDCD
jgi:hypothetical protein